MSNVPPMWVGTVPMTGLPVMRLLPNVNVAPLNAVALNVMSVSENRSMLVPVVTIAAPPLLLTTLRLTFTVVEPAADVASTPESELFEIVLLFTMARGPLLNTMPLPLPHARTRSIATSIRVDPDDGAT